MVSENLRVVISKKMMKEGLIRCLKTKNIEKLSISELCRESQVNRATFYNHYSSPKEILIEIVWDYVKEIQKISEANKNESAEVRLTKGLNYIYDNREDILTLMDENLDEETSAACMEAVQHGLGQLIDLRRNMDLDDREYQLAATAYCRATEFLLQDWLRKDDGKTPKEIAELMMKLPPAKIYK